MRKNSVLFSMFGALLMAATARGAEEYQIDPVHSRVGFSVTHMMVTTVEGNFRAFTGKIVFDEQDPKNSSVEVSIETGSIDTDNEKRDGHLKSPDFFDADKNAAITFKSSRIVSKGDAYVAVGTLTLRGVAKEVQIPFRLKGPVKVGPGKRIGIAGELELNRQDYGVSWSKSLDGGGLVVSDEVSVKLNIEAIHEPGEGAGK